MMRRALLCLLTILVFGVTAYSQQASLSLDHVDGVIGSDPIGTEIMCDVPLKFWLRFTNNTGANITTVQNGFSVFSPDGAEWDSIIATPRLDLEPFEPYVVVLWQGNDLWPAWDAMLMDGVYMNPFSLDGQGADTIGWTGRSHPAFDGIPNGFDTIVYLIETTIDVSQIGLTICLDSCFYPPIGDWAWTSDTGADYSVIPEWNGPHCFTIVDCCQGTRGNVNMDPEDKVNISDVTYLTKYLFGLPAGPAPTCTGEANVNGDPEGSVNISDVTELVDYLFGGSPAPTLGLCGP